MADSIDPVAEGSGRPVQLLSNQSDYTHTFTQTNVMHSVCVMDRCSERERERKSKVEKYLHKYYKVVCACMCV